MVNDNRSATHGGTALGDEAGKPSDWNKTFTACAEKFYSDQTSDTHTGSTTETTLGTITIPDDDLGDNATLDIQFTFTGGGTGNVTWRIKVDGSTVYSFGPAGASGDLKTLRHIETGVDTTGGDIDVTFTVEKSGTGGTEQFIQAIIVGHIR